MPLCRKEVDWGTGVVHHNCRGQLGAIALFFSLGLNPAPDIEISCFIGPGDIPRRQLRNLNQTGFNGVEQPEIRDNPRKWLPNFISRALDIKGGRGEIDAQVNATPAASSSKLVNAIEGLNPDRCFAVVFLRKVFVLVESLIFPFPLAAPISV